jgi:hypothetical protein
MKKSQLRQLIKEELNNILLNEIEIKDWMNIPNQTMLY